MTFRRVQQPKAPFGLCEFIEDQTRCAKPARWDCGGTRLCWRHVQTFRRHTRWPVPKVEVLKLVKLRPAPVGARRRPSGVSVEATSRAASTPRNRPSECLAPPRPQRGRP